MRHVSARTVLLSLATLSLLSPALAQGPLRDRMRARMIERMQTQAEADRAEGGTTTAYGPNAAQTLRYWPPSGASAKPGLIVFVHGGGWRMGSKENATGKTKVEHLTGEGYALASLDYRLVPDATVEEQAADVAAGVAYLVKNAVRLGFDPTRIVLMGHSAGAHLVTLVGTDPRWLTGAGLSLTSVRGIIALDGAAYDVPAQMADGPEVMQTIYTQAFGTDPARQKLLSPTWQVAAPNAPAFLLLHIQREDGTRQTAALAAALRKAGTSVTVQGFDGQGLQGHMEINRRLGDPTYPATAVVDGWLRQTLR